MFFRRQCFLRVLRNSGTDTRRALAPENFKRISGDYASGSDNSGMQQPLLRGQQAGARTLACHAVVFSSLTFGGVTVFGWSGQRL